MTDMTLNPQWSKRCFFPQSSRDTRPSDQKKLSTHVSHFLPLSRVLSFGLSGQIEQVNGSSSGTTTAIVSVWFCFPSTCVRVAFSCSNVALAMFHLNRRLCQSYNITLA